MPKGISPLDRQRSAGGRATGEGFICIYCRRQPPQARPSEAHIFPEALGGSVVLTRAVCIRCNGRIAREVETPARDQLTFFQSIWGIRGKSRRAKGVRAIFRYAGEERPIRLDHRGEPPKAIVLKGGNGEGGTRYRLLGRPCEIERRAQEISPTSNLGRYGSRGFVRLPRHSVTMWLAPRSSPAS